MSDDPKSLGALLFDLPAVKAAKKVNTLSRVHRRLIEPIETEQDNDRALPFSTRFFVRPACRTGTPATTCGYGSASKAMSLLAVQAGHVANPATRKMVEVGLPWGAKPRLILAHLNAEALRQDSPVIEVESSLSAFVKRIRGFDGGREIRFFKDQLTRLSAATLRLAVFA